MISTRRKDFLAVVVGIMCHCHSSEVEIFIGANAHVAAWSLHGYG